MTIRKSWDRPREDGEVHAPEGVDILRREIRFGLKKKYTGLAESMWRYETKDERFQDMMLMSMDTVPEVFMMKNGQCVFFEDTRTKQIHALPLTMRGGVNMYGRMVEWSPIPVGYTDTTRPKNEALEWIADLILNADNSVIMRNDLFGAADEGFIDAMIAELVDNLLTLNQLQLLAKCPFVFNVSEDNLLTAKNFYLALSSDKPAIFVNHNGESPVPVAEVTNSAIDTALFELFYMWESQILEFLGYDCTGYEKKAQMTVSESTQNDQKIFMRRQEKLRMRELACDRINKMWGTDLKVISVLDEQIEQQKNEAMKEGDHDSD